jgi:hypothetical protein
MTFSGPLASGPVPKHLLVIRNAAMQFVTKEIKDALRNTETSSMYPAVKQNRLNNSLM